MTPSRRAVGASPQTHQTGFFAAPGRPQRPARAGAVAAACVRLFASVSALPVLLAACTAPPASLSYFPLEAGHRWAYDQTSEWENNTVEHEPLVLHSLGEQSLATGGSAWQRRSESGVDYWLRADATGIYRVASKTDTEADPTPDATPRYVLKLPLAVGSTWQASTTTYLLRRNAEFPPEIRHSHKPVPMVYRIEALGEAVTTRAGAFKDCIRVQGQATLKLFTDPVNGIRELPISTTEWYCKGVGLVKLQRAEPAKSSFLTGGLLTLELTEWQ